MIIFFVMIEEEKEHYYYFFLSFIKSCSSKNKLGTTNHLVRFILSLVNYVPLQCEVHSCKSIVKFNFCIDKVEKLKR